MEDNNKDRRELARLKQDPDGYEDNGSVFRTAKEQYMRPLTRLDNFFYYSKWILLIGAVAAVMVIFMVIQSNTREAEDMRVVLVSYDHSLVDYEEPLKNALEKACPDYSKDGEAYVLVRTVDLTTREFTDQYAVTESEKLSSEMRAGVAQMVISDEEFYDFANIGSGENNVFVKLSGMFPEEALYKEYGVRADKLMPGALFPENLIIYVRAALPEFNNSKKAEGYRSEALEVLRALKGV